jgi:aryl-alcohol dehydrogenase-like predicted oxidoreductase
MKPLVTRLRLKPHQVHASLRGTVSEQDFSPTYIVRAAEASLRRLKTDYIDLYQLHDPHTDVLRRGDFVEPLERLRQQGKIRYWGVACRDVEDACVSLEHPSLASVQVSLSVLEQHALSRAVPRAAGQGVGIIARQVFASGLLTRRLDALRPEELDSEPGVALQKQDRIAAFASLAERCGRGRAEMALHFALARQDVSVVLLGMSSLDQMHANLRALEAPRLSDEELTVLSALAPGDA